VGQLAYPLQADHVNPLYALITVLMALACPLCSAQDTPKAPSRFAASLAQPVDADAEITTQMAEDRQKIAAHLRDYLVAFDASHDSNRRVRVGLPLTSFADNQVHVAYDVAGGGVMMQWHLSELTHRGTLWQFNAFVNQAKTATVAVSANF